MAKILGIDLGTTNSAMAVVEAGEPRIIENKEGMRTTPSIAAVSKSGERLVGVVAKRQTVTNPVNTIFSVKRLIGRKFSDPVIQNDRKVLPYEIRESSSGGLEVKMSDKWHRPEEISAMVLAKLKHDAEDRLGQKIEEAIITCPAYFDDSQRQATKAAGEIAGFKVRRVLNEPTAAALAYGFNKQKDEKIVVYDFGGGTFDISILEIGDNTIEVKSTGGDTHLGGDDFDRKIIDFLIAEYKKQEGIDLSKDPLAIQRLKEAAERAKHELSSAIESEINLPYITSTDAGPKHFLMKLTRAKLEELVGDYISHSLELVRETLREAKLEPKDINEIILVGGQTRMPAIQEAVAKMFGKAPHKDINPDEVVAIGAAVQAGILQGDVKDVLLLDVTPLTLGIETLGGVMTPMIQKNTTIPTAKTETFSTASDSQPGVEIHVLQGERPMARDNKTLGKFMLEGIPPAPRGMPQIEVSFDIDANGILNVTAKDKATGKSQSVRIEGSTGLTKDEIERMKREAEVHAEEDKQKKELVEVKNNAEALIWQTEKSLNELGDSSPGGPGKVPVELKSKIEEKVKALKAVKEGNDIAAIKQSAQDLAMTVQEIGKGLYEQPKGGPESGDAETPPTETPPTEPPK